MARRKTYLIDTFEQYIDKDHFYCTSFGFKTPCWRLWNWKHDKWNDELSGSGGNHFLLWDGKTKLSGVEYLFSSLYGRKRDDLQFNHKCHNGWCVNPRHMYLGNTKENMADRDNIGTTSRGAKHAAATDKTRTPELLRKRVETRRANGLYIGLKGEENNTAKLTEEQVLKILARDEPARDLADRFNVATVTVYHIRSGRLWKHLQSKDS